MTGDQHVGLVGIGLVGSAVASLLLRKGFSVIGYDVDATKMKAFEKAGGIPARNPCDVGEQAGRVLLSLFTTAVVRDVVFGKDGLLSGDPVPRIIIDTTTGDPVETLQVHGQLAGKGIAYIDAPVSGSSEDVRDGRGVFLVGGNASKIEDCRDILDALGETIHIGLPGTGMRAKLVVNLVLGLNRAVLAEGIVFAEALGIEPRVALDLFAKTPATSRVLELKGERMVSGRFRPPAARVSQHYKDVALLLDQAKKLDIYLPLSELHRRLLAAAVDAGDGDLDNSAIIKELRRQASKK